MNFEMGALIGFGIIALMYLLMFGIGITNYILTSLGLYTIADRRGISNPWLAWLPVANSWIIGAIADEYDERNGLKRKWRLVLLILNLIAIFLTVAAYVISFASAFTMAIQVGQGEPTFAQAMGVFLPMFVGMIFAISSIMAAQICVLICLYKIFESTVPEKSVKYLLLSLLLPLASAICLMICRKKGYSNPDPSKAAVIAQFPEVNEVEDVPSEEE